MHHRGTAPRVVVGTDMVIPADRVTSVMRSVIANIQNQNNHDASQTVARKWIILIYHLEEDTPKLKPALRHRMQK